MMPANRGGILSEAEFRRLWFDRSLSQVEIGRRLGISGQAVRYRAKSRGLPMGRGQPVHRRKVRPDQEDEFGAMWRAGVCIREIAGQFGMHVHAAERVRRRLGLPPRGRGWRSPISLEDWQAGRSREGETDRLRELFEAGLSHGAIAQVLGCGRTRIARLCAKHGLHRHQGCRPAIALAEWQEQQLAARLAEVAARETRLEQVRRGIRRAA